MCAPPALCIPALKSSARLSALLARAPSALPVALQRRGAPLPGCTLPPPLLEGGGESGALGIRGGSARTGSASTGKSGPKGSGPLLGRRGE